MKIKRMRYKRKKVFFALFLFLLIVGIGVGYALITTKLSIEGVAKVKEARWDINFDNYAATTGSVTPTTSPTITDATITFSAKVDEPGDFYGFTFDVVNAGTINAELADFSVTPDFSTINYIDSTIEYENGAQIAIGDLLPANKSKKIKVLLSYKDGIDESLYPTTDQSFNVTISLKYQQYIGELPIWILPSERTKDNLQVGDEICLVDNPTQCFNFIKYDNNDVVMLAKYNLNVGDNSKGSETFLQDSDVRGSVSSGTMYGNVPFSATNYWNGKVSYPADVYDAINYATAPDFSSTCNSTNNCYKTPGYSIAYYVEQYRTKLTTDYGATIKDARLLKFSEVTDSNIGCQANNYTCNSVVSNATFIKNTTYWLATARDNDYVWYIYSDGAFSNGHYNNNSTYPSGRCGVRPVIVVEKSDL